MSDKEHPFDHEDREAIGWAALGQFISGLFAWLFSWLPKPKPPEDKDK